MTDTSNISHSEGALIHSGSDERPYDNYRIPPSSLPIPIPKPNLPPLLKLKNRRLQINPSYFKAVPIPTRWICDTALGVTGGLPPEPDPKEYKYIIAPNLKSKQ